MNQYTVSLLDAIADCSENAVANHVMDRVITG